MAWEGVISRLVPPLAQDVTPTSPPRGQLISTRHPSTKDLSTPKTQGLLLGGYGARPILLPTSTPQLPAYSGPLRRLKSMLPSSSSSLLQIK